MLRSFSLCSFLQHPANFSLLGPNIPLSTPFSNTLSVGDKVPHPHKATDKFVSYILIFKRR